MIFIFVLLVLAGAPVAFGQAMSEAAVITSGSATAGSAGARGLGKSLGNIFGGAAATTGQPGSAGRGAAPKGPQPSKSKTLLVLPSSPEGVPQVEIAKPTRARIEEITEGTTRKDVLAKLGAPSFAFSKSTAGTAVEVVCYRVAEGGEAEIRLSEGKVIGVSFVENTVARSEAKILEPKPGTKPAVAVLP